MKCGKITALQDVISNLVAICNQGYMVQVPSIRIFPSADKILDFPMLRLLSDE